MALAGKQVVVTRAPHQAGELAELLAARGAVPLLYPCIDIAPPVDDSALNAALERLSEFEWLILTSENTVYALASYNGQWPKIAAVGPATAQAASDLLKVEAAFIPEEHSGEALAHTLPFQPGARIFLPQSEIAPPTLAQQLTERGAVITTATAYRTLIGSGGIDLPARLRVGDIHAMTLTSGSAAHNLVKRLTHEGGTIDLLDGVPTACIGESTAAAARQIGIRHVIVPKVYTLADMVSALEAYLL